MVISFGIKVASPSYALTLEKVRAGLGVGQLPKDRFARPTDRGCNRALFAFNNAAACKRCFYVEHVIGFGNKQQLFTLRHVERSETSPQ